MVNIFRPTLVSKTNREAVLGVLVITFVILTLLCSTIIALLTVKVTNITASNEFKYAVQANGKVFDLVPYDILRIDRTPARRGITGQQVVIIKIYTSKGFIYAVPDDEFYYTACKLANAVDVTGAQTYTQKGVTWDEVQQHAYAIGTPDSVRPILFTLRGIQNLFLLISGISVFTLIFPIRPEQQEEESSPVVTRMEQPA